MTFVSMQSTSVIIYHFGLLDKFGFLDTTYWCNKDGRFGLSVKKSKNREWGYDCYVTASVSFSEYTME